MKRLLGRLFTGQDGSAPDPSSPDAQSAQPELEPKPELEPETQPDPEPQPAPPPDEELYNPLFSPWLGKEFGDLVAPFQEWTLVSPDRLWVLASLAEQAVGKGEFWECGVYKGGAAMLLSHILARSGPPGTPLRLFDTFAGMPESDPVRDRHGPGDFQDTDEEAVAARVPSAIIHPGFIPDTFQGLEDARIGFAHVDTDIYQSVLDCCHFIYPRLATGGFLIFDDYGFPTCPGAREAVDEYFSARNEARPLVLPTGQAVVFKGP